MKRLTYTLLLLIALTICVACQSKEEKTLSGMQTLSERIDQKGDQLTDQDWDQMMAEYEKLSNEAEQCEFTDEQAEELGRIQGRLMAQFAKQAAKDFGKELKNSLKQGAGIIEGLMEGLSGEDN